MSQNEKIIQVGYCSDELKTLYSHRIFYIYQRGKTMGGISIWQLLIIVAIVVLLFGTKKLRTLGSDLGESVKGFKKAMQDEPKDAEFKSLKHDEETAATKENAKEKEQA